MSIILISGDRANAAKPAAGELVSGAVFGLFTWSGGPRSSGVSFFCFDALGDTKQKRLTPLDRGPPLHVNRVLLN